MNPLIELDQLNLDSATQTPVAAMILKPSAKLLSNYKPRIWNCKLLRRRFKLKTPRSNAKT